MAENLSFRSTGFGLDSSMVYPTQKETDCDGEPGPTEVRPTNYPTGDPEDTLPNIHRNLVFYIKTVAEDISSSEQRIVCLNELDACCQQYQDDDPLSRLLSVAQFHRDLIQILSTYCAHAMIGSIDAQDRDNATTELYLRVILGSSEMKERALALRAEDADLLLCVIQDILDDTYNKGSDDNTIEYAPYFYLKVALASLALPESLFLSGVKRVGDLPMKMGGHADIYKGKYRAQDVTLKRFRIVDESASDKVKRSKSLFMEANMWQSLSHENILPFLGLDAMLFPRGCVMNLLHQVARGIQYLHHCKVVHGNIRGSNIFIDDNGNARLADHSLAGMSYSSVSPQTGHGSIKWMAPELWIPSVTGGHSKTTYASDVYSYACVCLEVLARYPPFPSLNEGLTVSKVIRGERPGRPTELECHGRTLPDNLWELMEECWRADSSARPSIDQITLELSKLASEEKMQ